jgi:hypothetical protein
MYATSSAPALRDALYELSMAKRVPDAETLDDVVRRFPVYAEELTAFAIDLALDALRGDKDADAAEETIDVDVVSPAVSRALSRFQNRLHNVSAAAQPNDDAAATVDNPFLNLSREEFRDLAERLGANVVFLNKLRDRQIAPSTMTDGFRRHVAEKATAPLSVVVAHCAAAPNRRAAGRQYYKADEQPDASAQQSFADAVRSSGLTSEQQERLLSL